ncbi:MAG: o-succinylbenzoate synthase [Acidimicrobiales bacterium]
MDLLVEGAFRIPLRVAFRGLRVREGMLLRGPQGWGEYSPLPGASPEEAEACWRSAREAALRPWPPSVRHAVPVHATVPEVSAEEAAAIVRESSCPAAKVKVGDDAEEARVEAVRDALGPGGRIRIDANGAWDVPTARSRIRRLARYGLELVEQPVPTLEEMAELRRLVEVPLAADESVRTAEQARRAAELSAADALVVKVQPAGGVWAALALAEAGLPVIVSSWIETSVGLAAGLALAAALESLPYACGLATGYLLQGDVVDQGLRPSGGAIALGRPPVSEEALARFRVDPVELPFTRPANSLGDA